MDPVLQSFVSTLYSRYYFDVRRYTISKCHSPIEPEEVESDIWYHVCRGAHTFTGGNERAWLFTIAHNRVVEAYRRQGIRYRYTESLEVALEHGDGDIAGATPTTYRDPSPYPVVDWETVLPQIRGRRCKEVLILLANGMSRDEAAAALSTTPGNVRLALFRAKQQIRELVAL